MGKQRYSKEFKEQAMSLIRQGDRSLKEISKTLGINYWTVREWNQQEQQSAPAGEMKAKNEKEELRKLRRENQDLRMENAILKKFAAILSKDQQ